MTDGTTDLPTDEELAEYLRETWDSDDPETWIEHFGLTNADGKERPDVDNQMRDLWIRMGL